MRYEIDPDIARAQTLDPAFYASEAAFAKTREKVFARTWQWLGDTSDVETPGSLSPRTLLPGLLDEPLLLARDNAGSLRCLSNVCTHRGNILVAAPCRASDIRCGYHSRRFDFAGRMTFMPGFAGAHDFPSPADDLPQVPFVELGRHGFAALSPVAAAEAFLGDMIGRTASLAPESFVRDPSNDRDYDIAAHWALYVENYLEGFHVPYVHAALASKIDVTSYATELFAYTSLQQATARDGEPAFDGTRVAAMYWFVFPNLMLNFYPWGLSVNVVEPQSPTRTRVRFLSYVGDATKRDGGAGGALDRVEEEDEAVVEAVQRGVRSRLYRRGRYSPTHERAVHHFHRPLCRFIDG
jgi:phenylpropionate dioxygenase-like ring-hydroxylating dioxygenase large terminal subunit